VEFFHFSNVSHNRFVSLLRQFSYQNDDTMKQTNKPKMPPGQQLVAPGKWPIIGERLPASSAEPWTLTITGAISQSLTLGLNDLARFPHTDLTIDIHCVTRWSKLDVSVSGILLSDLLQAVEVTSNTKFVSFVSRSTRNHSSSLPLSIAVDSQTIIATHVDGNPLAMEHGGPLRNIVPGRYFYKSVKWLTQIQLLEQDQLGFWEAESGYHNNADPWGEERYMAPTLDRRAAGQLIEQRDFSGKDLRSIDCSQRELAGLIARGALLRNGNFRNANLLGADFSTANLSNAHFEGADLSDAKFIDADLEGANLSGARMCGTDFSGASLIGASFGEGKLTATIDANTLLPDSLLSPLTPIQYDLVQNLKRDLKKSI
jgi:DMSO/TMAO reductase YedYZ molybdopterin-dependent catalytic subunit